MPPLTVTVYSQPNCQPCNATRRQLTLADVPFTHTDVTAPDAPRDILTRLTSLGHNQTPVVLVHDASGALVQHWSGYRPDALTAIARTFTTLANAVHNPA